MNYKFSRITMIALLLFATSGIVQGMGSLASKVGTKTAKAGATDLTSFIKSAVNGADGVAAKSTLAAMKKTGIEVTQESFESLLKASKSLGDDFAKVGAESADQALDVMATNLSKLKSVGADIAAMSGDDIVKFGSKDFSKMTSRQFGDMLDEISPAGMSQAQKKSIKSNFANSGSILKRTSAAVTDIATDAKNAVLHPFKSTKSIMGKSKDAIKRLSGEDQIAYKEAQEALNSPDAGARYTAGKTIKKMEYKAATNGGKALRYLSAAAHSPLGMIVGGGLGTIYVAILFMIPSLFQSAFLAQQQENAMLQTYIPPTKFGNIVMQLPDSVIDMTNPMASQFIYYGIPVNNPGEKLSAQAKAAYPGVSDPTAKNKISEQVDNTYAQAFSFGATKKISIPRYNLDASALASLPIFVSYTDQSWSDWASNGIPDAAFTQTMINLNTGYIFYADGTSDGTPPANLVGTGVGKTVSSFMSKKLGQLKNTGSTASYREFHDSYSAGKAGKVVSSLSDQFDCSCLGEGALTADTVQKCSGSKKTSCLLTAALNQLATGLVLNSQGQVLRADQDLATELANGALGQIVPIQGYGDKFDDILRLFPGAEKEALANSGVLTISLGSNVSAAPADIAGAPADNYAAKGVYVYQCQNTPLAKMLRSQAGGNVGAHSYITDFIVFLDQDLNQVPLMVPVQDPTNYNFIKMDLNPAIKYFSTIIGSLDGNGGFSFLPQLNIQSPAALTAKGLPATFAPLYSLQASNGSLAVNYNQNLSSAVGGAAQALIGHAKLGQQFKTMQAALLTLLNAGPFGQYQLAPVADDLQPNIGGVQLKMYTGFNCYPVTQDAANANCSDVLIPLSAAGKTVTLPSSNIAQYYGLVSDLTYSVRADGTIAVDAAGFTHSPLAQNMTVDAQKASEFYWMNKLTGMGQSSDPSFVMPDDLVTFVTQARTAWMNWIAQNGSNKATQAEFAGIKVAGTSMVLTIASQQALTNGLYVYTASPCPSSQAPDYFVLVNSATPQLNDAKVGTMSALQATADTKMLSIVSGLLYTMSGQLVKNSAGAGYSLNPSDLLKALNAKNPKAFADDFKAKLNISNGQAVISAQALVYPFNFGGLQLGIYQADLNSAVYLYVDAAGAAATAHFAPSDYFVTVDSATNPTEVGTKLTAKTQFLVSLVSGHVYSPAGIQGVMDAAVIAQMNGALAPSWRSGIVQNITALKASLASVIKAQQQETDQMNSAVVATNGSVKLDQASAQKIIAGLATQNYLPVPYNMLKQDTLSGMYILVTPANDQETEFLYTFFDVPNSFVDTDGSAMRVGAAYDAKGNMIRVLSGMELSALLHQYGVTVDATGHQYLGVQNASSMIPLDPADKNLKPGVSGKSMIYSNDAQFPSFGIVSPISYLNSKFYIYFNMITQNYYAMRVTGTEVVYIDMVAGNVYNLDGSARADMHPVAIHKSGDTTDMLLPYANPDGFVRCVMKNSANKNMYSDFLNLQDNFQVTNDPATNDSCGLNSLISLDLAASNVQIAQMPFAQDLQALPQISAIQKYNVYTQGSVEPATYLVSSMYAWQDLQLLPIDMTSRAMLKSMPNDMYDFAQLILKNNQPYACIIAGQWYGNAQSSAQNVYTMSSATNKITVSMKPDAKAQLNYVEIVADKVTYNYQYMFMKLSDAALQDYRASAWQADVVADATGKVILEKDLPADDAGNVQLSAVTIKSVVNAPSDTALKAALQANINFVLQDSVTGRFVAAISNGTYAYFTQDGYVDLENGILFDAAGYSVGYPMQFADLIDILNQLSVSVVRNQNKQAGLRYRPISQQAAQVVVQSMDDVQEDVSEPIVLQDAAMHFADDAYDMDDLMNDPISQESSRVLGTMNSKVKTKKNSKK